MKINHGAKLVLNPSFLLNQTPPNRKGRWVYSADGNSWLKIVGKDPSSPVTVVGNSESQCLSQSHPRATRKVCETQASGPGPVPGGRGEDVHFTRA